MDTHLGAAEVHDLRQTFGKRLAVTVLVYGYGRLMPVFDCPDDVLGTEGRVAAEEHARAGRLKRHFVHHRHVPLVKLYA